MQVKVLSQEEASCLCSYGVRVEGDRGAGATPEKRGPRPRPWARATAQPVTQVNLASLVNVSHAAMLGEHGVDGPAESLERGRRPVPPVDELAIRSRRRNPGYRGWDAQTEPSGTNETSTRRGPTCRVTEGIRQPPKSGGMRDRGVGGGHSTDDGEDNRTSPEGRTSASAARTAARGTA